jgi:hypothetical protein|tara:strand:- start:16585 stop:16836 length:252 start_codon:yes stop_codon:yes gene_type:complete
MEQIIVALLGVLGLLIASMVEWSRRTHQRDHAMVLQMLKQMGDSLGRSIDRVEQTAIRTEKELDGHIADHARGAFNKPLTEQV